MTDPSTGGPIFISYARDDDEPFVHRLRDDLVAHGHTVWWDRVSMESRGKTFLAVIRDAIEAADRVLLVVGPKVKERPYAEVEWRHALRHGVVVTPVLRKGDHGDLPKALAAVHCEDVREHLPEPESFAKVRRLVSAPVLPLGPLVDVRGLPSPFIARPELLDHLLSRLLVDAYQPIDLEADQRITSVAGMGGIGKSVLATALARTAEVRRSFQGGVIWIDVGKNAGVVPTLERVGLAVGDDIQHYSGVPEARILLGRALRQANCLLILDDVWEPEIVDSLHRAAGERVRILMTSRHQKLFNSVGVHTVLVNELGDREALELLAGWTATPPDELPAEAAEIIGECGNLPLALSMIGALIRGRPERWAVALANLRRADLSKVAGDIPGYEYHDLDRAMLVSFEDLDDALRSRYLDLAVIPEDTPAPSRMIERWWTAEGAAASDAVRMLDTLAERSLVRVHDDGACTVHDVQRDFLLARVDAQALHDRWVTAFRPSPPDGWHTAEDDGYLLDHLGHHLRQAGCGEEWRRLLTSFEWLDRKATARGFPGVLQDLAAEIDDPAIALVEAACRRAAHLLANDPSQLAAQLLARLDPAASGPEVARLLDTARSVRRTGWLRPVNTSLTSVGDPLRVVFRGREKDGHAGSPRSIALSTDGRFIASGGGSSNDLTVKLWSVNAAVLLRTFDDVMSGGGVAPLAFVARDGRVAAAAADRVNLFAPWAEEQIAQRVFPGRAVSKVSGALGDGAVIVGFHDGGVVRWNTADDSLIELREMDGEPIVALTHATAAARVMIATSAGIECRRSDDGQVVDQIASGALHDGGWANPVLLVTDPPGRHVWFGTPACTWTVGEPETLTLLDGSKVLAITPDGKTALVASGHNSYEYDELLVVTGATGTSVGRIRNSRKTSCLAMSAGGDIAVTADYEHDVKVWDLHKAPMELTDWERRGRVHRRLRLRR